MVDYKSQIHQVLQSQGLSSFTLPPNESKPIPKLDIENLKSKYNLNNNYQYKENNYELQNQQDQQILLDIKKARNEIRMKMGFPNLDF